MSFTKIFLIAMAITAHLWATEEHVYYTCTPDEGGFEAFSFHFNRELEWRDGTAADDQKQPTFDSTVIINMPDVALNGKIHGRVLGGRTRLTGDTEISVFSDNSLKLSLIEDPSGRHAFGHGSYLEREFLLTCSIAREAEQSPDAVKLYRRFRWIYENGVKVCYDDKAGNVVPNPFCLRISNL